MTTTIAETLKIASTQLRQAEVPNDLLDAQLLLAEALQQDRTYLVINYNLAVPEEVLARFHALVKRRSAGEPLQYILGRQEFFGLEFEVNSAVLIPRPETELIVEEVLRLAQKINEPRIIDVGTGSGCIAVTLAREISEAKIIATDISPEALQVAARNAEKQAVQDRLEFVHCDLLSGIAANAKVDFIVSNPPYIAPEEMPALQREVRDWEPHNALTDFQDGLNFYRRLLIEAPGYLQSGGYLIFEMGYQQAETIKALVDRTVWREPKALRDLQGIVRTFVLTVL